MTSSQMLQAEFERRATQEGYRFSVSAGNISLTTWGVATILTGLWANDALSAIWGLEGGRQLRIWRTRKGAAIVLLEGGRVLQSRKLPSSLNVEEFYAAVEGFVGEVIV